MCIFRWTTFVSICCGSCDPRCCAGCHRIGTSVGAGGDGRAVDLGCIKTIREGEVCGMGMIDREGRRSGKLYRTEVRKYWLNFGKGVGGVVGGHTTHTHTHTKG